MVDSCMKSFVFPSFVEYISDFGEEVAKLLEPFSMTKIKVVKENKDEGFYIGRFKELKNMKPKAKEAPSKSKEPSKPDKKAVEAPSERQVNPIIKH